MEKYGTQGFLGLGFPSNDFYLQEPGDSYTEILDGLKYVRPGGGYVPNFQMFKKIDVNGQNEHPLYKYLKGECGPTSEEFESGLFYNPLSVSDVRWNFEIFLTDKKGSPKYRYSPDTPMDTIEDDIKTLLASVEDEEVKQEEETLIEKLELVIRWILGFLY
ncbi:glutathione peroxidase [Mactra antiquata]